MKVEKGMKFRHIRADREILILSVDGQQVTYKDLKYGTVFHFARQYFDRTCLPVLETVNEEV